MVLNDVATGEVLWAGSDEWEPWTNAPQIRMLRQVPSGDFYELWLVEASLDGPTQFLVGVGTPVTERLSFPFAARAFQVPVGWDGGALTLAELKYAGDIVVGKRRQDVPTLSPEQRERRRRGWAF
jgi:hypothetical protein